LTGWRTLFDVPQQRESRLKTWGTVALVPIGVAAVLLVGALYLIGMIWFSNKALPWLSIASLCTIGICILVLSPLCIFRKTRPWAGLGFYYASFVFGVTLFAYSCLFVVSVWGIGGLVIGLIFAGVGVVPVALVAALLHAQWSVLGELALEIVLTFGTRFLGLWLSTISETQTDEQELLVVPDVE
jgi:hypothetical protein